jgi:hypothetical protein
LENPMAYCIRGRGVLYCFRRLRLRWNVRGGKPLANPMSYCIRRRGVLFPTAAIAMECPRWEAVGKSDGVLYPTERRTVSDGCDCDGMSEVGSRWQIRWRTVSDGEAYCIRQLRLRWNVRGGKPLANPMAYCIRRLIWNVGGGGEGSLLGKSGVTRKTPMAAGLECPRRKPKDLSDEEREGLAGVTMALQGRRRWLLTWNVRAGRRRIRPTRKEKVWTKVTMEFRGRRRWLLERLAEGDADRNSSAKYRCWCLFGVHSEAFGPENRRPEIRGPE